MRKIEDITNEEIIKAFETCNTESEVIKYFGRNLNGGSWRFINKLKEKANIVGKYYQNQINREEYKNEPKYCKLCGKELTFKQRFNKFCSSSCAAKYNNVLRGPHSLETKIKISKSLGGTITVENIPQKCINCGKEIKRGKYCSQHCKNEYEAKEKTERWLKGENFVKGVWQTPLFIRRYLFLINNEKCEKCGWGKINKVTGKTPLEIHHKDGDCTNNHIENLELLCPNCHSLTENNGSLNKNSKRFYRKKLTLKDIENLSADMGQWPTPPAS